MSRPERRAALAFAVVASLAAGGCGKSNLVRHQAAASPAAGHSAAPARSSPAPAQEPVAIPLRLTASRASRFSQAVNLRNVDVPGSHVSPRPSNNESRQEEAAECKHEEARAIGGGRSPRLERGHDLEAESISSSVIVMPTAQDAQADLAFTESKAGLACYRTLLSRKLAKESNASLSIGHVRVAPLHVALAKGGPTSGIRIEAHIRGTSSGLSLGFFVDVVSLQHGPAEIELYATSFVQPVPLRTEQGLLGVMWARARLSRL